MSVPSILEERYTVANLAANDVAIRTSAGTIKSGSMLMFISAPTETKNRAANMSRSGIDSTRAMACDLDSATNTPAKKAPAATEMPMWFAMNERPKIVEYHRGSTDMTLMAVR